jgi:uncharacterized protein YcfJ
MKRLTQAIVATLGLSVAGYALAYHGVDSRDADSYFDYAHVERIDRVVNTVSQPTTRQECWSEPRQEYHPNAAYRRDETGPTVVAASNGEQTVIRGEVTESGGYYVQGYEQKCRSQTDYDQTQRVVGYDVVYNYRGEDYHDRMSHDPGASVRVHVDHGYVELAE